MLTENRPEKNPVPADNCSGNVNLMGTQVEYRHVALALLTIVYMVNYLDRTVINILMEPIKRDLGVSDSALGFLTGLAFTGFYILLGIPIAWLADRYNRKRIIVASVAVFSVMTVLCGQAASFFWLVLARVGVGVGEAGTGPSSHSMIADLYPAHQRATALSVYAVAINIGMMIGYFGGGWVSDNFGWRAAFVLAGIPGIVIAILCMFILREPIRGRLESGHAAPIQGATIKAVLALMWSQRSLRYLALAVSVHGFVILGIVTWIPAFLMRVHQMSGSAIGAYLAVVIGVFGGAGALIAGRIVDRSARTDIRYGIWAIAAGATIVGPLLAVSLLADSLVVALAFFAVSALLQTAHLGVMFSLVQSLVPVHVRSVAASIMLLVTNFVAGGLGPLVAGLLSDMLIPRFGIDSLSYACILMLPLLVVAVASYLLVARYIREDIARVPQLGREEVLGEKDA